MLILNSSDSRPRYVRDIATAVASPTGSTFQFRYQSRYLAPDVQRLLASGAVGAPLTVCFVGNRHANATERPFLVPVRAGRVVSVDPYGDAYVITISAEGYPDLQAWPRRTADLMAFGCEKLTTLISNNHDEYYAGFDETGSLMPPSKPESIDGWTSVVERLLCLPTFESTFFLRVALVDGKGEPLRITPDGEGWLRFDQNTTYRLRTWFYGNDSTFDTRTISLKADGETLSSISDQVFVIRSRYDRVDFWFTPKAHESSRRTVLRIVSTPATPSVSDVATELELRCLVPRPVTRRLLLSVLAGASATAVATPALLGQGTDLPAKIAIAAAGALGVALATGLK